jgi:exodeoxyribonuclease VII large subunit
MTPDIEEIRFGLDRMDQDVTGAYTASLYRRQEALSDSARALRSFSPQARIRAFRQRLDDWSIRSEGTQRGRLALLRTRIEAREQALVAANPQAILERGYALIADAATGRRIKSAGAARGRIAVQFHDGAVEAEITTQE